MEDTELTELDDKWFSFTSKYVSKLNDANERWEALTEQEQELAALWKLEMDMHNGGFVQFISNWGFDCYTHAVRCLKKLKATQALDIVQQQYKIIQHLENDKRVKAVWDIADLLFEKELEQLEALDQDYCDNTDNIIQKTLEVYKDMAG
jgi:NAD-dependent DNA ligase